VYRNQRVLDLYAGSGSLGIEALSLGASWGDFVEQNHRQCEIIRANLKRTGFDQRAGVFCGDVRRTLNSLPGAYSLVLLDPPYRMRNLSEVLDLIAAVPGLVEAGGMVVAGHSRQLDLPDTLGRLRRETHRRYGDNAVDFYRAGEPVW
jgi:16S rRNA (guanine(966)-N(2))-methyltransferase RsmD